MAKFLQVGLKIRNAVTGSYFNLKFGPYEMENNSIRHHGGYHSRFGFFKRK